MCVLNNLSHISSCKYCVPNDIGKLQGIEDLSCGVMKLSVVGQSWY